MTGTGRRSARGRTKSPNEDHEDDLLSQSKPVRKLRKGRSRDHSSLRIFGFNLKAVLGLGFVAFFILLFLIRRLVNHDKEAQKLRFITPLPAPKIMDLPQFQGEHRESLYWGTYRPHVYFGIRARTPRSLVAGLMWLGAKDGQYFMRHVCQDADELSSYGWTHHNGRDFGYQVLVDHDLTLTTSFLKSKSHGSGYGGDWAVRIDVQSKKSRVKEQDWGNRHIFFYLADEDGNELSVGSDNLDVRKNSLLASGSRTEVGRWQLHLESKLDHEAKPSLMEGDQ